MLTEEQNSQLTEIQQFTDGVPPTGSGLNFEYLLNARAIIDALLESQPLPLFTLNNVQDAVALMCFKDGVRLESQFDEEDGWTWATTEAVYTEEDIEGWLPIKDRS